MLSVLNCAIRVYYFRNQNLMTLIVFLQVILNTPKIVYMLLISPWLPQLLNLLVSSIARRRKVKVKLLFKLI